MCFLANTRFRALFIYLLRVQVGQMYSGQKSASSARWLFSATALRKPYFAWWQLFCLLHFLPQQILCFPPCQLFYGLLMPMKLRTVHKYML